MTTTRQMAERWLQVVRNDIATTEQRLATLKQQERECVEALSEENGKLERVREIVQGA